MNAELKPKVLFENVHFQRTHCIRNRGNKLTQMGSGAFAGEMRSSLPADAKAAVHQVICKKNSITC